MRSPSRVIIGLGLVLVPVLPTPSVAQTLARADLVGTWVRTGSNGDVQLTLNADSTWTSVVKRNGVVDSTANAYVVGPGNHGRWYLFGDSLWFGEPSATDTLFSGGGASILGGEVRAKWGAIKAVVSDKKLYYLGYASAAEHAKRSDFKLNCNEFYCYDRAP